MVDIMRAFMRFTALAAVASATAASSRPYTVDDLLKTEGFGRILVAPGGRWLLFERRAGRDKAAYFDERSMEVLRSRVYRVDLARPRPAIAVLPADMAGGTIVLGYSPLGSRAAIARLDGDRWSLGILTLDTGSVRWFDIAPDYYPYRTTISWASESRLLLIAQPKGGLPYVLGANRQDISRLKLAWEAMREGSRPTVTAVGSGRYLGVTSGPTQTDLLVVDVTTGSTRSLAHGALQSISVSPGGGRVAVITETEAIRMRASVPTSTGAELRHRALSVIEIASGRRWEPCPACDVQYMPPAWAPSGHQLLFFARSKDQEWSQGRVWRADVDTMSGAPLAAAIKAAVRTPFGDYTSASFGWAGSRPILFGRPSAAKRDDWYRVDGRDARSLTAALPDSSPTLVQLARGAPIMLGGRAWRLGTSRSTPILREMTHIQRLPTAITGSTLAVDAGLFGWEKTASGVVVEPGRGRRVTIASREDVRPVTVSASQGAVVAIATDRRGRGTLLVARNNDQPVVVSRINAHLADIQDVPPMRLRHRLANGQSVTSWLYLPTGAAPAAKLPLVVIPYATMVFGDDTPRGYGAGDGAPFTNVAVLRDHGYAVLLPSMPALPASDAGPDLARQVLSAVDAAVATGAIDAARLGMWGHSYGGYTVAMIATQTNRFRAAIASNGIFDLATLPGTFTPPTRLEPGDFQSPMLWFGWAETGQPGLGGPAWTAPMRYAGSSPIYHAERIVTPMLIVAGERDFSPLQQSEQLFSALYRQGKDAMLLSYWGEEHNMASPANLRDSYQRILAFLDEHLGRTAP